MARNVIVRPRAIPAVSLGAMALGAMAFGVAAIGALAIGRLVMGKVAIGQLVVRKASFAELDVDLLTVRRLRIVEDESLKS